MKNLLILTLTIALLTGTIFFFFSGSKENVLTIGTNAEYPPYALIENGAITGFDIEVAKTVFEKLELPYELIDMPFDALLPQLQMNQIDVIAAGVSKTEKRAEKVLFSSPYFSDDPLVMVALQPTDSFIGKTVVVNEGFHADLYVSSFKEVDIVRLPAIADALLALKSHQADIFVTAYSTAKQLGPAYWVSEPIGEASDDVSLVVAKNHPELLHQINGILDEMKSDGTMDKLKRKWGLL